MAEQNLFTLLSSYRPGTPATPFENYTTSGLAYFLGRGQRMLGALFTDAAGAGTDSVAMVEVQPVIADGGVPDLLLTFEGGQRAVVEVEVEPRKGDPAEPGDGGHQWAGEAAFVRLGIDGEAPEPWRGVSWLQVVEALEDDPDPLAQQYAEFVLRDVLGLGPVPLEQAVTTNRLYALGGAVLRQKFGDRVRYENSASGRPIVGKYRYLGTTFALDGGPMEFWLGLVNEELPLSEHYHLMLASKDSPVQQPAVQPRATGDWKWKHWTGAGRVVRPITAENYQSLLERLQA